MSDKPDVTGLVNMNLSLMNDEVSKFVYLSQVYYNLTGDYSHIARMLRGLWQDYRDSFTSDEFKNAVERCLPEIEKMVPVKHFCVDNGTMFFDPAIVTIGRNEVFCDCGALEMASSLEFVYRTREDLSGIYAFEPDPVCSEMCHSNLSMFGKAIRDRIFIYDFGLDEINGTRPFKRSNVPGNSKIAESSEEHIQVRKLDDLPECQDISYLKIHTEGSEFSVIKGAAELIRRNRPVIAVSLYHNLKELINVPLLLHGLVPEYQLFMRHYSTGTSESVLYAVRKEETDEQKV